MTPEQGLELVQALNCLKDKYPKARCDVWACWLGDKMEFTARAENNFASASSPMAAVNMMASIVKNADDLRASEIKILRTRLAELEAIPTN